MGSNTFTICVCVCVLFERKLFYTWYLINRRGGDIPWFLEEVLPVVSKAQECEISSTLEGNHHFFHCTLVIDLIDYLTI